MGRPIVRNYVNANCDYCGKPLHRIPTKGNHFYCNRSCYALWMKEIRSRSEIKRKYSDEQLINELNRIVTELGHVPTFNEFEQHSTIQDYVFRKWIGSWLTVKKLMRWKPDYSDFDTIDVTPEDGGWLAGIIDGEGCFRFQGPSPQNANRAYSPVFIMSLRDDDEPALRAFETIVGKKLKFSICTHKSTPNANPAYKIQIRDLPTFVYHFIPILEKYPLRSKKKYELQVFKYACNILMDKRLSERTDRHYTDMERSQLDGCFRALSEMKVYQSDKLEILVKYNLPTTLFDNI